MYVILLKCLTGFGFLAIGAYSLAIAFFPSWREKSWSRWKSFRPGNPGFGYNPFWLGPLGFVKRPGDWDDKTAALLFLSLGLLFSLVGIAMIVLAVLASLV